MITTPTKQELREVFESLGATKHKELMTFQEYYDYAIEVRKCATKGKKHTVELKYLSNN